MKVLFEKKKNNIQNKSSCLPLPCYRLNHWPIQDLCKLCLVLVFEYFCLFVCLFIKWVYNRCFFVTPLTIKQILFNKSRLQDAYLDTQLAQVTFTIFTFIQNINFLSAIHKQNSCCCVFFNFFSSLSATTQSDWLTDHFIITVPIRSCLVDR